MEEKKFAALLFKEAQENGVCLEEEQLHQFFEYNIMMVEKNKVMNLTAITQPEEVITKHFVDSIMVIQAESKLANGTWKLMDVGTGAGFPGIPLKIAFPSLQVTLLDSLNKRVKFLDEVITALGLKNIRAVHGRAEDYGILPQYREQYDFCVSRAVAGLSALSEYCVPFIKTGGEFISYKAGDIEEELAGAERAIRLLGCRVKAVNKCRLTGAQADRSFVMIEKIRPLEKKYPRKAGLPSREPL